MDLEAARRARRKAVRRSLLDAYDDEEACPPEWVELMADIRARVREIDAEVAHQTERFVSDPDVRAALERRERGAVRILEAVAHVNARIARLNLIAPMSRFTRNPLDGDELLRPLYRSPRKVGGAMPSAPAVRGPGTPRNP